MANVQGGSEASNGLEQASLRSLARTHQVRPGAASSGKLAPAHNDSLIQAEAAVDTILILIEKKPTAGGVFALSFAVDQFLPDVKNAATALDV